MRLNKLQHCECTKELKHSKLESEIKSGDQLFCRQNKNYVTVVNGPVTMRLQYGTFNRHFKVSEQPKIK